VVVHGRTFLGSVNMLSRAVDGELTLECCMAIDNVCHGREGHNTDFFFMYTCFFTDSHIRVPFYKFTMSVLCTLNMTPTELHPNF